MALQDGFGDDRREIDYEQELLDRERLLKLKAAERLRASDVARDIWDDVLQEGRIVEWQVLQRRPDAPRSYVSAAMSNVISRAISAEQWTGMPTAQGRPRDPIRRRDRSSVDDETTQLDEVVGSSASSADWADHIMWAYHRGEIMRALSALTFTQREYVVRRFWGGWTNAEIAEVQRCSKQTVERHWREEIRPALIEHLRHLASA